jgi:hypothetical protein
MEATVDDFRVDRAESVADLLTEDAEFRGTEGREAITELLLSLAQERNDTGRTSRHLSSNVTIDELGGVAGDRVRSLAIVLSLNTQPNPRVSCSRVATTTSSWSTPTAPAASSTAGCRRC